MKNAIEVNGLKKYFGDVKAVDDISFQVDQGELFGFLGINGAGKSTTINMLCTLYPPTAGEIQICGFAAARASHIAIMDAGHIKEYGTPFSLKETYAKDKRRLYSKSLEKSLRLAQRLEMQEIAYKKKQDAYVVSVPESMAALQILDDVCGLIDGFEMVQGSMDDVFLNVTGKALEGKAV